MEKKILLDSFLAVTFKKVTRKDFISPAEEVGKNETVIGKLNDFEKTCLTLYQMERRGIFLMLMWSSIEERFPDLSEETNLEIRKGFKIVSFTLDSSNNASEHQEILSFQLCPGCSQGDIHGHFINGKKEMVTPISYYSKTKAKQAMEVQIKNGIFREEDRSKLLIDIERSGVSSD